ncbi:hypothetical protein DYB31_010020 [Aphanomyces astaci]|uniref:Uncharacterized protein n=1 Tax=Aphanomyces astaci TaxID=112090 RepID=A0A397FWE9_APHAT|nr:hypothetical protein DYB31_010020 [Aphanomyces astaci]
MYRSIAASTGLFAFLLWKYVKKTWMSRRSSWTRSCLKDNQKKDRLEFCQHITGTKDVYRRMLLAMVVPAIKSKWIWPAGVENGRIILQHDNDRHHIPSRDAEFVDAGQHGGWDIRIENQPA